MSSLSSSYTSRERDEPNSRGAISDRMIVKMGRMHCPGFSSGQRHSSTAARMLHGQLTTGISPGIAHY